MFTNPLPSPAFAYAPELSRRVSFLVRALVNLIACRFRRHPRLILLNPVLGRYLLRVAWRFGRLLDRVAAGHLPRPRRPRARSAGPARAPRAIPAVRIPTGHGWIVCELGWEAAGILSQLQAVLAEPTAAELLALVPAAGRILRPVLRMLVVVGHPRRIAPPAPGPVLSQFLSPEWGRPPEAETWHRTLIPRTRPI